MSDRPPIENELARLVRQDCGFGCVLCGCPLYDVHHIDDYSQNPEHAREKLALLCPTHHREATNHLLPKEQIIQARGSPHNRTVGRSRPHRLHFSGDECTVWLGDSDTKSVGTPNTFTVLMIDGVSLMGFRFVDGNLLLQLLLLDECDQPILIAVDGQLQYLPTAWDIQFRRNRLTLKDASRRCRLELVLEPPTTIRVRRGLMWLNGIALKIEPQGLMCVNTGATMAFDGHACQPGPHQVALAFGRAPNGLTPGLSYMGIQRYQGLRLTRRVKSPRPAKVPGTGL